MDPITALAAATAMWSGIKATVDAGREVQDVFGQLGAWAEQANKVYEVINHKEGKPSIFSIIKYEKSETREAFDIYSAKVKMREMEAEIRHMFLYGALNHLSMKGYNEFLDIRTRIRVERLQIAQAQRRAQEEFRDNLKLAGGITLLGVVCMAILGFLFFVFK